MAHLPTFWRKRRKKKAAFTGRKGNANGSIRFSLSIYNTGEEIDYITETLSPIIERFRICSPTGMREIRYAGSIH
jgi:selenocysteine lyase/cysteine desulfurase